MYKIVNLELGETAVGGFTTEAQANDHIETCNLDAEIYGVVEEVEFNDLVKDMFSNRFIEKIKASNDTHTEEEEDNA